MRALPQGQRYSKKITISTDGKTELAPVDGKAATRGGGTIATEGGTIAGCRSGTNQRRWHSQVYRSRHLDRLRVSMAQLNWTYTRTDKT